MLNRFFLLTTLVLSIFLTTASAQTEADNTPKTISGGVLNGKATNLVKPVYPKEAKAARADGAVLIQVTVDEEGNVISASAVNGHALLLAAAEQAARASKFSPTKLGNQPVRVMGVIVYNFVLDRSLTQIGYELALAQKTSSPEVFPLASIVGSLPNDWKEEKTELYKLDAYSTEKLAAKEDEKKVSMENKSTDNAPLKAPPLRVSTAVTDTYTFRLSNQSPESVEILKNLQARIENRFSADEKKLWHFRIGMTLGSIAAETDTPDKLFGNLSKLKQLLGNAPSDIPASVIKNLEEIAGSAQSNALDAEQKNKLLTQVKKYR